ncbi:MAG: acyl--CoA ligase [Deltaproteobacteria bacterium]|nr:acyl--CoA ligase [Deltaproteobacteria bacterium]
MNTQPKRIECEIHYKSLLHLVSDYIDLYAVKSPKQIALIEYDTGAKITYRRLARITDAFAAKLLALGLKRGDVIATSLPFTKEHIFLEYACFKLGIIVAPLDLRLKAQEIIDAFEIIKPCAYFFLGETPKIDFRPIVQVVMQKATTVKHFIQFQKTAGGTLPGAVHVLDFARDIKRRYLMALFTGRLRKAKRNVTKRDPALIIFTTGSTGFPKAALLAHENILIQNIGLAETVKMKPSDRMLINLPPSHVGGQTEQLMTTLYTGATAVLLHVFDAEKSLKAIAEHRITLCGQIPTLFNMQWRLPNYEQFDLSSLRAALYGGETVSLSFLERLNAMTSKIATGLGLTETAGFCTYTPISWKPQDIAASIGFDTPLCPISIRKPMQKDGSAGEKLPAGEIGEICFNGPQIFLGYMNNEEATRATISTDGVCYTGDLGRYDERGLHYASRVRFVIKTKGYQVFPAEIESFIAGCFPSLISAVGCVGVPHEIYGEAIVAFIELASEQEINNAELSSRMLDIAAYKRPSHVVFLKTGEMPYNRVTKIDVLELKHRAEAEIKRLRKQGKWDQDANNKTQISSAS